MKIELVYLLLTALLTGVLWIPVVIGYVTSRGALTPEAYRVAPTAPLPPWVNRANRAHLNAVENFAPFAAVVVIAQLIGFSNAVTVDCAAVYSSRAWRTRSCTSAASASSRRAPFSSPSPGSLS